ncbi:pyridoxamine 5'-phosphate oxidase family protein [Streptomyces sp. TUS-ST3]|uniref:pyridoxamine 5'-phosphate oxidase family protein n=1 Tax=Streptomyces sp. TUS-ST3 TaxID=3025591 RepID=UPI0024E12131|nr:pyridoxamine 5'-phosphate oxidase family protein [Streptomyces sp. TUS-ST3]
MEIDMRRFNAQEVGFLEEHLLGRLATTGKSGKPHVVPIRYHFDPEHEVIKMGGRLLEGQGQERLYVRHLRGNPQAALVVDDVPDEQTWQPRGILIKGATVLHTEGGEVLGPGCGPNWIEVVPSLVRS